MNTNILSTAGGCIVDTPGKRVIHQSRKSMKKETGLKILRFEKQKERK